MSDRLSRRRYVAGTGAALTIGTLAGCGGGGGDDGSDGSDGMDGDDGSDGMDGDDGSDGSDGDDGSDGMDGDDGSNSSDGMGGDDDSNSSDGSGGSNSGGGEAVDDVPSEIDDYLDGARLYEGTIADYTGQGEVTVSVGAGDDGLAFGPPAIRIDSGTTVVWEWTGEGGAHNVVSTEGSASSFDSGEAVSGEGETFEQSFDDTGIQLYRCVPHEAVGMLGAIQVV